MDILKYATKNIDEIACELEIDFKNGLTEKEADARLEKYGSNLFDAEGTNDWRIFFRQFKSAFVYLLFGAMAITIALGELIDTLMIFIFLAINTGLGFYQEYSSEKTAQMLKKYSLGRAKVIRDGKILQLTADKLVPGDIIKLETGDKVPADVRLIEKNNLSINETVLTGESVPVFKKTEGLKKIFPRITKPKIWLFLAPMF